MSASPDLERKDVSVESLAKRVLEDKEVLCEVLKNDLSKEDTLRYNSFKVLNLISEKHPEVLYPKWDFFVDLIDSGNAYRKLIGVRIIENLTRADTKNKFNVIFEKYYNLFNDSVIVAGHLAADSGRNARAKRELQSKITNKLLNIDKTDQKYKDLVKAGL